MKGMWLSVLNWVLFLHPSVDRARNKRPKVPGGCNEKGISDHSDPAAISRLGCCSDRFIIITIEFASAYQQHFTINIGRAVNDSQQRLSADQLPIQHFALEPDS
jgi:hypothetical protein